MTTAWWCSAGTGDRPATAVRPSTPPSLTSSPHVGTGSRRCNRSPTPPDGASKPRPERAHRPALHPASGPIESVPMSRPTPPALTVRYEGSTRTFAPGNDVVVGRDLRADVRVGNPLISRAHLVLRFDQGRWLAIDNGSLNGMYVNGRRVPVADIQDGLQVNIGNPDGPGLRFEVGRHQGSAGTPPPTTSVPVAARSSTTWSTQSPPPAPTSRPMSAPHRQPMYPSGPQPRYPSGRQAYPSGPSA